MADPMIAALVREVLSEELSRIRGEKTNAPATPSPREETVSITSDADLQALVKRVLSMAENAAERKGLLDGNIIFRLANQPSGGAGAQAPGGRNPQFDSGLLSERLVDQFPAGTTKVQLAKHVQTTPLARDRLRQRGISIERMK
ncbi:MAG: hypothetical protein ISR45_03760 [Rhodospirillales bacterium]|nr:hypothetical protein [Rhodospirillales bacterium]